MLSTRANEQQVFFCNSGAEAAEAAIKLARLYSQPRYKIITLSESFHGRTFAAISATGQPAYRKGFTPTVPGFSHAKINDFKSVEELIDEETCAVMLELVQGESGVHICTHEFLNQIYELCKKKNLLLITDEVQTSPARLGKWFGYQNYNIIPDIMTTAKALAGGMPMGAILAKKEIAKALVPGMHASTFGGNSIGCAAGIEMIRTIEDENLMGNIQKLGLYIDTRINELQKKHEGSIRGFRRAGFMIGIDLAFNGTNIVQSALQNGLLINCTHDTTLRMLPAYNITESELSQCFDILDIVLGNPQN